MPHDLDEAKYAKQTNLGRINALDEPSRVPSGFEQDFAGIMSRCRIAIENDTSLTPEDEEAIAELLTKCDSGRTALLSKRNCNNDDWYKLVYAGRCLQKIDNCGCLSAPDVSQLMRKVKVNGVVSYLDHEWEVMLDLLRRNG